MLLINDYVVYLQNRWFTVMLIEDEVSYTLISVETLNKVFLH